MTPSTPGSSSSLHTQHPSRGGLNNSNRSGTNSNTSLIVNSTEQSLPAAITPRRQRQNAATAAAAATENAANASGRPTSTSMAGRIDRRKDIKLTNCQEKDGIWTATGQFGRESRHSKRADIFYDKKKFKFTQKDEHGNKHVYEIPVNEVEGRKNLR